MMCFEMLQPGSQYSGGPAGSSMMQAQVKASRHRLNYILLEEASDQERSLEKEEIGRRICGGRGGGGTEDERKEDGRAITTHKYTTFRARSLAPQTLDNT